MNQSFNQEINFNSISFMKRIITFVCSATLLLSCSKKEDGIKPTLKPVMEAVYASGFVVSKDEYEITAQVEGYVVEKIVEDGDVVKKGDPLYVIDSDQQSARNRIAHETFDLASKNYKSDSPVLSELKAALEASQTKMKFDSANFVRYSNLLKENATSKAEFDRIKLAYDNSRNEFTLQKSRYEKTKNQLSLEYENARNNLVIASNEAGRYIIRSQADGMVFMTTKDKGEYMRRSEVVAVVGRQGTHFIQLNVDELDVQKVKAGQEALVKIDAYPNKVFKTVVSKVYPMVDRKQQAVRVDAELKEALPGSFSGLALEANIIIRKKDAAIVIPKSSLLPGDSVRIKTDDGEMLIKVKKGIETLDEVEIIDGLDTSKLIVQK
jgi:HlyD family secretion protein